MNTAIESKRRQIFTFNEYQVSATAYVRHVNDNRKCAVFKCRPQGVTPVIEQAGFGLTGIGALIRAIFISPLLLTMFNGIQNITGLVNEFCHALIITNRD